MPLPSVESVSTASVDLAQQLSIDMPATASDGKLLVAVLNGTNAGTLANVLSGWTEEDSETTTGTGGAAASSIQSKPWASGDPASFTFTFQGGVDRALQGVILCIADPDSDPVAATLSTNDGNAADATFPAPDVTVPEDNCLVLRIWTAGTQTVSADNSALEARTRADICATTGGRRIHICDEDQLAQGASGVESASPSTGTPGHTGYTTALRSAAIPPKIFWQMADDSGQSGKKRRLQNWLI